MFRKWSLMDETDGGESVAVGGSSEPVDSGSAEDASTNWAELADDSVTEGDEVVSAEVASSPTTTPTAPTAVPVPTQTPAPAQPATPEAELKPELPTAEQTQVAPAREDSEAQYAEWKNTRVDEWAKNLYALTPEQAEALITEPEKILPTLAARVHMQVLEHAARLINEQVPSIALQQFERKQLETEAENVFFTANPDLKDSRYIDAILNAGQMFRKYYPGATKEQAARGIGELVRTALNLQKPAAAAPQMRTMSTSAAHIPARAVGGGGTVGSSNAQPVNVWDELANDDLD